MWPAYMGLFVRKQFEGVADDQETPNREVLTGMFGLVPHWAPDTKGARHTYNARSETVAEKPSYRDAWRHAKRCIIPASAIYEPDWRSGKAVPTRISRHDGKPMGIAGLWASWPSPKGDILHSYTMLTINADSHPLMHKFHKPTDEKRMVVILPDDQYGDWLNVSNEECRGLLKEYPADLLTAEVAAPKGRSD
jgi:putative SOS response-associated peptidase YedK